MTNAANLCALEKRMGQSRGCAADRRASLDNHEGTQTQYWRKGYRYIQAQEKASQTRRRIGRAAQNEARPRPRDRGKADAEQWIPDQISGWLRTQGQACVSRDASTGISGRTRETARPLALLRHNGKKYNKRKAKTPGAADPGRVDIAERPLLKMPHRRLGGRYHHRPKPKGAIMTHVDRSQNIQSLHLRTKARPPSKASDASLLPSPQD